MVFQSNTSSIFIPSSKILVLYFSETYMDECSAYASQDITDTNDNSYSQFEQNDTLDIVKLI